jgi:aminobenzoyl-glutamate utilization protein B
MTRAKKIRIGLMFGIAALSGSAASAQSPDVAALKARAVAGVDARAKLAQVITDSVFSFSELGMHEVETSKYLTALLEKNGFTIERGVAGMPTAWVAKWTNGTGGPEIALGSDLDCIPKASQKPGVPYRDPLVVGAPGHGEGHNSGQAVNIVAALAVKEIMIKEKIPGTLMLWPGVAEELLAGKAFMVRAGVFKDADAVLFTHVGSNLGTRWGYSGGTGLVSVEYSFHGEAAHSAVAPWRGRSALDGVELMDVGWNFKREHLRPEQRSHYVIRDGGDQPNVVPPEASVWYYFREQNFDAIKGLYETGNTIAQGAATMSFTTVTHRLLGSAAPGHFNRPIAEDAEANIKAVGLPKWTDDEQAFAKLVQKNINAPQDGLDTELGELRPPPANPASGPSDDIGDVSWNVPTIVVSYPANIPNLPGHNWVNAIAMATPIAHKGVVAGSKVIAMTTLDLLLKPELRTAAKDYFANVQTKTQKYVPMLAADDKPPIELNTDTMARYAPQLKPYYYNSAKYGTYLEQLGIKWPMLTTPPGKAEPAKGA